MAHARTVKYSARVVFVLGLSILGAWCLRMWSQICLPFPQDYGEGLLWWLSAHSGDFTAVYKPLDTFPYVGANYPPVYLWVAQWVSALTGDWMFAGRLVSCLSTLTISGILAWMIYRSTPRRTPHLARLAAAAMAGLLPLSTFTVNYWARFARVDMLALLFLYAGLAVFVLARKSERGQFLSMTLFVVAAFTKQTTLSGPAVCVLLLLVESPRRAIRLATFGLLLGGGLLIALNWATNGGFLLNTVGYNLNPFDWSRLPGHWKRQLDSSGPLLAAAVTAAVVFGVRIWRRGLRVSLAGSPFGRATVVLIAHFATAFAQSFGIAKLGANVNYFLELDITGSALAGLLLFGVLLAVARPRRTLQLEQAAGLWFLLLVMVTSSWFVTSLVLPNPSEQARIRQSRTHFEQIVSRVASARGPVYVEDLSVLMRAGKPDPRHAPEISSGTDSAAWAQVPLLRMIQTRRFEMMVIENVDERERYTPTLVAAIKSNYQPAIRTSMGDIWTRKGL